MGLSARCDREPGFYWVQIWYDPGSFWGQIQVAEFFHDKDQLGWYRGNDDEVIDDDRVAVRSDRLIPPTLDDEIHE